MIILPFGTMPVNDTTWEKERHSKPLSERVMQRYVSGSRCLWATLSRYVDGAEKMQYCVQDQACSVCQTRGIFRAGEEVDTTKYWDIGEPPAAEAAVDDETSDEEEGDQEERAITRSALQGGSQRLRQSERVGEEDRARYLERCRRWKGTCFICQLLGGGQGLDHNLDTCRNRYKYKFFDAKKTAVKGGVIGWMKQHTACWNCGQLPTICDGLKGPRGCDFRDMVLPGTWAMIHMKNLWGQSLAEVSGQPGGLETDKAWIGWLGQECEVFGERGTQAVRMLGWVLEQMEKGELAEM